MMMSMHNPAQARDQPLSSHLRDLWLEPPVTPASVEPVQEPVGSPIRKDSVKQVRFQVEQKGYHGRSGRLSKPPHRSDM